MIALFEGFIFSSIIGFLGYKKGALTKSGVIGAIIIGTLIFGLGKRMSWYLPLIIFFLSSSLLSAYRKKEKNTVNELFEKTGKRDIWQALANGGWAAFLVILGYFLQEDWVYIGFVATFATVNADTWATEIGVLSKGNPRFVLTFKPVPKGTSGAISVFGLIGSSAGAFLIGLSALLFLVIEGSSMAINWFNFLWIVNLSGIIGALVDSILGATVQANYTCSICGKSTEKNIHCEVKTIHKYGWKWMNNDMVNFFSSVTGSIIAVILYKLIL